MSEFKGLGKKLGKTAAKAIKKTEEVADIAVKYVKLRSIDAKLDERYEVLGKLTYKQIKNGESYAERIAAVMEEIDVLREKRAAIVAEIEEAKKAKEETADEE
jgi:hypothetical protein